MACLTCCPALQLREHITHMPDSAPVQVHFGQYPACLLLQYQFEACPAIWVQQDRAEATATEESHQQGRHIADHHHCSDEFI